VIDNTNTTEHRCSTCSSYCTKDGLEAKFCIPLLPLPQISQSSDKTYTKQAEILLLNTQKRNQ